MEKLQELIQQAVDAENMIELCCGHLTSLIKNGRVKDKIRALADTAKANKEIMTQHLIDMGVDRYYPEQRCRFCNMQPESFSLAGAVNLGLEAIDITTKLYNEILRLNTREQEKARLEGMLSERNAQKKFLKKEKDFIREKELREDFIGTYCIPEIITKLYK